MMEKTTNHRTAIRKLSHRRRRTSSRTGYFTLQRLVALGVFAIFFTYLQSIEDDYFITGARTLSALSDGAPSLLLSGLAKTRRKLRSGEFFYPGASLNEIQTFFEFNDSELDAVGSLPTFWKCSDTVRPSKLLYIHIPRSAGSTIGALIRGYAEFCRAGLQLVTHCVDLSLENMHGDDLWRNNMMTYQGELANSPCQVDYSANRTGFKTYGGPMTSQRLSAAYDILGGRLPLGADEYWFEANHSEAPLASVTYITVMREPLHKITSQLVRRATNGTLDNFSINDGVTLISNFIEAELLKLSHSDLFATYLITPAQKYWVLKENILWTPAQRTSLSLQNLVRKNVVVGLVERFPQTLDLVRYLLDQDLELNTMFEFFGSDELARQVPQIKLNMLTHRFVESIVQELRTNDTLSSLMDEYFQYDARIYQAAKQIHDQQYEWLQQQSWWARQKQPATKSD